jgi:O-antigen/teichoic acid export membrane protein
MVELGLQPALAVVAIGAVFALWPDWRLPQVAMGLQVVVAGILLVIGLVLLASRLPGRAKGIRARYHTRHWLGRLMPFTLLGGAGLLIMQADVLILGLFRPAEEVGIYRVAVQGAMLVTFGLQAVNAVTPPEFARSYRQGDRDRLQKLASSSALLALLFALPVGLIFIAAGGSILAWVFGSGFAAGHLPLAILTIGQMGNVAAGSVGYLLNMTGHENDTARVMVLACVLNVGLNLALIPPMGATGAAVATALSLAFWNVVLYRLARKRIAINPSAFNFNRSIQP